MKNKIALLVVALITIFAACKKNVPFSGAKVATRTDFRQNDIITYTYNSDGTIQKISSNNGSDTTFSYGTNTVMESDYGTGGYASGGYLFYKNSDGQADSAQGTPPLQNYYYSYLYDANNMVTQQKVYLANGTAHNLQTTYTYTNSGKNIYEIQTLNNTNNTSTYDYFTFFSSNSNSIGWQDQGKYHLGASATSPIQMRINISNSLDTNYVINYRYAYDGSGRIDTMVSYKKLHGALTTTQVDSMAFSYY